MSTKTPVMYKDRYLGIMKPEYADLILQTREQACIESLKHMIFNFPPKLILRSLEEKRSIRSIIKEENIDYSQYIGTLRDYQTVGTAFMYLSPRSMLGDSVGVGKTAEMAGLINYLKQTNQLRRFLMAVETSALAQTQAELIKFTGLYIVTLPSESTKMRKAIENTDWRNVDGIIIKHSALRSDTFSRWLALNLTPDGERCNVFDTFILDESSVIKNVNTKTYMYTKNICDLAGRVHFMNATVFETKLLDIYLQFDMMNSLLLPSKYQIEKKYCKFSQSVYWKKENGKPVRKYRFDISGYKNQAEFKKSLELVYLARSKKDIKLELPHVYKVYEVEPTADQSMAIAQGYRYMEVLHCPSLIKEIGIETKRETVPKLDRVISLIENEFSDSKVMIYCFHIEAQHSIFDELIKAGRKPAILNGENTDAERWEIQSEFNNPEGKYDVVITNIKKSLNLYGGDVCIFYNALTVPAVLEQVRGRIDRNVDKRTKTFILLLYKGTDEYKFFMDVVKQRSLDSRALTVDAETAVDYFIQSMQEDA